MSPLLFILALDQLVQCYDKAGDGVNFGNQLTYRVLGYADDAAMLENRIEEMTERLTTLADKSKSGVSCTRNFDKKNIFVLMKSCKKLYGT